MTVIFISYLDNCAIDKSNLLNVSSFPRIAAISIAPPGVNCLPEIAKRNGNKT